MPFSIDNQQGRQILKLSKARSRSGTPRISAAMLGKDWKTACPLGVDTGGLEDIDTCILQLLCSLRKSSPGACLR